MANTSSPLLSIVVLASGGGSNLQALLDDQLGYRVVLVIADRPSAGALAHAAAYGVPARCIPLTAPRDLLLRAQWEAEVAAAVDAVAPGLVVMAGWMRVMSARWVDHFAGRVINQHPALLPDNDASSAILEDGSIIPAIRGAHAVRDALRLGLSRTGCTVHWVTPVVDVGPVLARAEVPVLPADDEVTLHERIKREERRLIVDVVRRLAEHQGSDRKRSM